MCSSDLLVLDCVDRIVEGIQRPAFLEFEDLQWADELSLEIVGELARRIRDRPILLIGAYRTDDMPAGSILREWRARLVSQRLAEEARLAPLSRDETALMATMILDTGLPAPREVVNAVYERTDGIPLHIEELLGALPDSARSDDRAIRDATVPATIEDAILARVERLTPQARSVARAGAVIGRCFVPEVLAGIMDLPVEELDEPLQELTDRSFLVPPGSRGLMDYRHQLLRDALYRSVPATDLRRLHARAAEFGAQLEGASEIHASAHYERAGLRAQAYRTALSGAHVATRLSSRREAYELYRRAIDNRPDAITAAEEGELLEAFCEAASAIEENERAVEAARTARERYVDAGRPVEAAMMLASLAFLQRREAHPLAGRLDLAAEGLAELAPLPASRGRDVARAANLFARSASLLDAMYLEGAEESAVAARDVAAAAGDPSWVLEAEGMIAAIDVLRGDPKRGLAVIRRVAREARDAGFEDVGVTAYRVASTLATRVQDYATAEACIGEGLRYADAIEQSHCRHIMAATGAVVAWATGRWDDALAAGQQEMADDGCRRATLGARDALGYVAMGRGDVVAARRVLTASLEGGESSGEVSMVLPALWGLAETDLVEARPEAAAERCVDAWTRATETGERAFLLPFVVSGVRANLLAGRPEVAERWLSDLSAWFSGPWSVLAGPAVDHGTGLLRLAAGSMAAARDHLERAFKGWVARDRIWEATWARLDLGGCLMRMGRYGEAASHLAGAREAAVALDSSPLIARADQLGRIARGRGREEEPWRPLTPREYEVARLIAEGMTNPAIADELRISPRTAGSHVEHILAKLGVMRRTEIATWVANISRPANPSPSSRVATTTEPVASRVWRSPGAS